MLSGNPQRVQHFLGSPDGAAQKVGCLNKHKTFDVFCRMRFGRKSGLLFVINSTSLVPTSSSEKWCTIWRASEIAAHSENFQKALCHWGFPESTVPLGIPRKCSAFWGSLESMPICRLVCFLGIPRALHYLQKAQIPR